LAKLLAQRKYCQMMRIKLQTRSGASVVEVAPKNKQKTVGLTFPPPSFVTPVSIQQASAKTLGPRASVNIA